MRLYTSKALDASMRLDKALYGYMGLSGAIWGYLGLFRAHRAMENDGPGVRSQEGI